MRNTGNMNRIQTVEQNDDVKLELSILQKTEGFPLELLEREMYLCYETSGDEQQEQPGGELKEQQEQPGGVLKEQQEQPGGDRPPFTYRQILNLCWGLTMNYSQDNKQAGLAKQFSFTASESDSLFTSYLMKDAKDPKATDDHQMNEKQKQFIGNVLMAVMKALRNLGLARDAHVSSLMYQEKQYEHEREYLEDVSSFSSSSKDSILTKIIPFLGGGSALTFSLAATGEDGSTTVTEASLPNIRELLFPQALPFGLTVESMILLFIASGIALMTAVTFILKARKKQILKRKEDFLSKYVKNDWETKLRPSSVTCLLQLYKDLRFTMNKFYPNYHDEDDYFSDDERAQETIENEIIVPESVMPASRFFIGNQDMKDSNGDKKE